MSSPQVRGKKHDDLFKSAQWNDVWALVMWGVNTVASLGVAGWAAWWLWHLPRESQSPGSRFSVSELLPYIGVILTSGIVLSLLLTIVGMGLIRRYPEQSIKGSFIANAAVQFLFGVGMIATGLVGKSKGNGTVIFGIVSLLFGALTLLFLYAARRRIPFSALLMRTVVQVGKDYPAMFGVAMGELLVTLLFGALHMVGMVGVSTMMEKGRLSQGASIAALIHQAFSLFWTQQVATNVAQTTVAGVYATFYFLSGSGMTVLNPTKEAFSRACTYSLGSICLGSLMVAVIQTLRFILRMSADRNSLAGAILDCLLSCLEGLVQYFNYYAYTFIAIYGMPYVQAASATWDLITTQGLDAMINDQLVGTTMGMLTFFTMQVCALATFLTCLIWATWLEALAAALVTFLLAVIAPALLTQVISAGVTCTFVCYADDPAALQRTKPELYAQFHQQHSRI